jgi:hypothetical protein
LRFFSQSGFGGKSPDFVTHLLGHALDILQRDLIRSESEHASASEACGEVFLQIGVETGRPVVAGIHPNAALDRDQHTSPYMRKIRPQTPLVMESIFPLQVRSFDVLLEHQEERLYAGGRVRDTVAKAGHGLRPESIIRHFISRL